MPRRHPGLFVLVAMFILSGFPALMPHPVAAAGTADLSVTMVGDKKNLRFGHTITFTVTATNLGPDAATGVAISIGVSDSYGLFGGTCPDGTVSSFCSIGTMASGASVTLQFVAEARNECCPKRRGVAVVSVFPDANTIDPVEANNSFRLETKLVGKSLF
jgi:uncharacterized repeat protein (TIGR01451 family)